MQSYEKGLHTSFPDGCMVQAFGTVQTLLLTVIPL